MEVMNVREEIESAEEEADVEKLKEANKSRITKSVDVLKVAFKTCDKETAKSEAVKLRYWNNIKDCLHAWEKGKPVSIIH